MNIQSLLSWKIKFGKLFNIPIYLHWSLIIPILVYPAFSKEHNYLYLALLYACVFASVLMHEFGHALTAKHYDYAVQYIMLHALGGTAVISDRIDFKTFFKHQFWITLNGPLVNVALAGIFYTIFQLSHFKLFASLVAINVVLFIFNLIPVFPMDGGRIFRSGIYFILKLFRGNRPTVMKTLKITNYVSWTTMILVISYGIYHQMPSLLIIMVFCFLAGKQEFKRLVFELGKNYNYVRF